MSSLKDYNLPSKARGRAYWRSLNDLAQTPEFAASVEREFPQMLDEINEPTSRRGFLKLMGASLALAGLSLTSCRWPKETIAPYANRPEGFIPGTAERYATAMDISGVATGLLVTSYDGRPIKVEGNPLHPGSLGAAGSWHQASVLGLYDIDRSQQLVNREGAESNPGRDEFTAFIETHFASLRSKSGAGLAVLSEASGSPTMDRLRREFALKLPQASWYEYEATARDNERDGLNSAFGEPLRPQYKLADARVIVSLGEDFLGTHPNAVRYARDFALGRKVDHGKMNRLYVAESNFSITGGQADHRLALKPSNLSKLVLVLAAELFINKGLTLPGRASSLSGTLSGHANDALNNDRVKALATDLIANQGNSAVLAGAGMPAAAHGLVALINEALGNVGKTVSYTAEAGVAADGYGAAGLKALAAELDGGAVDTLVVMGCNPAYDAPADLDFASKISKANTSIHFGLYDDETGKLCKWHVNRAHYLEAWCDARGWDGTLSVVQPLIAPLYDGLSGAELLALMTGSELTDGHALVRQTFEAEFIGGLDFENNWLTCLHDGLLPNSAFTRQTQLGAYGSLAGDAAELLVSGSEFELALAADYKVYDGRYANNGWLQEMPEPLTKITWDNAAVFSLADAEELGIEHGDLVELSAGGRKATAPVYVLPGQAKGCVTLNFGYGHGGDLKSGQNIERSSLDPQFKEIPATRLADGVGVNAYALRTTDALHAIGGLSVTPLGRKFELACTQDHHVIDEIGMQERERRVGSLVREANLEFFNEHEHFATEMTHVPPLKSLWDEHPYDGHRWAMAIDLNACNGCGACVMACQAENNIAVVGKQRVLEGREMAWIRIDRYFAGDPEDPKAVNQPVGCHHCELAPCEGVCPVAATVHTSEGLNDMVYNRCVGTRYCANNCPYKVRRFNYFNYQDGITETEQLQFNPEVTVRSRGVMEKCTYCVQRIQHAKIEAKNAGREVSDGEIVTACQQTCPAQAITFGNLNDAESEIRKLHDDPRAYTMLAELNVKPRTAYLAKLRNPAPGTPEHAEPGPKLASHGAGHDESTEAQQEH